MTRDAEYVTTVDVLSPDDDDYTTLEVWQDPTTGKLLAIDKDYMDDNFSPTAPVEIVSPYNKQLSLRLIDG